MCPKVRMKKTRWLRFVARACAYSSALSMAACAVVPAHGRPPRAAEDPAAVDSAVFQRVMEDGISRTNLFTDPHPILVAGLSEPLTFAEADSGIVQTRLRLMGRLGIPGDAYRSAEKCAWTGGIAAGPVPAPCVSRAKRKTVVVSLPQKLEVGDAQPSYLVQVHEMRTYRQTMINFRVRRTDEGWQIVARDTLADPIS